MRINEIFYSIQGEGYNAGKAAIFVRFSGCNLKCDFCDTKHAPYKDYTEEEIVRQIASYGANLVIITGGEPSLQLTKELIDKIHAIGKSVAVETNGTKLLPDNVDWITLSPKDMYVGKKAKPVIKFVHELKIVFDGEHKIPDYNIISLHNYLQPLDTGDKDKNNIIINKLIQYVKNNPLWKISLQQQKILGVR